MTGVPFVHGVLDVFLLHHNGNDLIVMQAAEEALRQKELQKEPVVTVK